MIAPLLYQGMQQTLKKQFKPKNINASVSLDTFSFFIVQFPNISVSSTHFTVLPNSVSGTHFTVLHSISVSGKHFTAGFWL